MNRGPRLRIAVIQSVLARFDAISNDVVRTVRFLAEVPGWEVTVFTGGNERDDIDAHITPRVSDLLMVPEFLRADVIIYHFGIYYPLFDAILIGNGRARQVVVFHNITPLEFVPAGARPVIEKSFEQLENLHSADAIWPDSRENMEMLLARGFPGGKMTIQPLAVDRPPMRSMRRRHKGTVRIVSICRIVPSKGVQDLVEAMGRLHGRLAGRVQVQVVGNLEAAEPAFRETLLRRIGELRLGESFQFVGSLSDEERDSLLHDSHILAMPSYHEGFCVPVIEALRAGMLPVLYSASNLRYIADGLCVSAEPGNIASFADALESAVNDIEALLDEPANACLRVERGRTPLADFEQAVVGHLRQFEPRSVADHLQSLVRGLAAAGRHGQRDLMPALQE